MICKLLIAVAIGYSTACSDTYPTPGCGGQYCYHISTIQNGQNCWGSCVDGCPTLHCPAGVTPCYMETRPISTTGSCIWPANTKLCCAHAGDVEAKIDFGFVVNSITNKTILDSGVGIKAGTADK